MSKSRIKITGPTIRTREEAEEQVNLVRSLTIARNKLAAEQETERKRIDDRFGPELKNIDADLAAAGAALKSWAMANPAEFGGRRSLSLTHGTLGWRTGKPALKLLKGFNLTKVLEKIGELFTNPDEFIRTKQEVNQQALIDQRASIPEEELKAIGVRITQAEAFFVDPKLEAAK